MNFALNTEEQQLLLTIARDAIESHLECRSAAPLPRVKPDSNLAQCCGAFVTLHTAHGALRGCIGRMSSNIPLPQTIQEMALAAAFEDRRFSPLTPEECAQCNIEISVLSPLQKCAAPETIEVGTHGLYLMYQGRSGVLLPQVPVEQGWSREEYLDYICVKAGVPPHSYNEPDAELYTFTAFFFRED